MRPGAMPPQQQQQQQQQHGQSLPPPRAPCNRAEENDGLLVPESWVEVSSHPSSSSVSSIGDEIVTTGLRVGNSYQPRRRRPQPRSQTNPQAQQQRQYPKSTSAQAALAGASSQEEYEESDSEDDRVLTSSTENITSPQGPGSTPLQQVLPGARRPRGSESSDDDENATALGRRPAEPFRPQPNAFTHPPSHLSHRHSASSAIPGHHPRPPSFSQRASTRFDRRASNFMTPADNDAALRASLTTLLSCAAAARGRPKDGEQDKNETAAAGGRPAAPAVSNQPVGLRMMSESELNIPSSPAPAAPPSSTRQQRDAPQPSSSVPKSSRRATPPPPGEKIKRSATPGTSGSKPPRATKKKKTAVSTAADYESATTLISPTLLTWVVSAGVVVLVSVVGFGAGYVIGREVGRQEALSSGGLGLAGNASSGGSCGAEVIRSGGSAASGGTLRRFRWGGGVSSIAA
ncbi:hypothetical protein SLS62_005296 [Diatrype stigma]|uniref:Uncharacterized protein n=1 Tax=Diatrype stigma TaxID=117547 RepID=A0AAN9V173_9PEZI